MPALTPEVRQECLNQVHFFLGFKHPRPDFVGLGSFPPTG
jgi:hypothetical protein